MTQKNYPASEPQSMCDVCSEAVTTPLCPFCLTTEIEAWLTLYPNLRQELLPRIKRYLLRVENNLNPTICVKCQDNTAFVCPNCFTEFVLGELKKISANRIVLKEFFEFFNFDFDHTDYFKEAEKLGVI